MIKAGNLVDRLDLWGFENGIALFRDCTGGFGFRLRPVDGSCWPDEAHNEQRLRLKELLGCLPAHADVQFAFQVGRTSERCFDRHRELSAGASSASSMVLVLQDARLQKFRNLNDDGNLPEHAAFVFVRLALSNRAVRGSLGRTPKTLSEAELERGLTHVNGLAGEIERALSAAGLAPVRLDSKELVDLSFNVWNPGRTGGIAPHDETDVRSKLLVSEVEKTEKGFKIGSVHHRVVSLKMLPESTFAGLASACSKLPFGARALVSVHVPDQTKEIEWLRLNRRMAFAIAAGSRGISDIESEAKLGDVEDLLNQVVKDGERIFSFSLHLVLRAEIEAELDRMAKDALQLVRELGGAEGFLETYAAFDIFCETATPNARGRDRARRIKSSNLCDLIPVHGPWSGLDEPAVLLRAQGGSLFRFDPFDSSLANANQIVSGGSGSGKSYLTNLMLGQMMAQDPRIFILDVGGSYQKTCDLLAGQYVELSMASGLSINPFGLPAGHERPGDDKIKFLLALVQIMTKEDDARSLPRLEQVEIERAILDVYRESPAPRLSDLKERLSRSESDEAKRIAKILSIWCGDTPYGRFVDRPSNVELGSRLVCFDMKGLETNQDLQTACLYLIMDLVWREVQRDRSEMKFLVLDECWRLMENEAGSQFVAETFRTFRKYRASAVAISQNIDDFARSKAASAILPNSSIKWVLKQPGADFNRLAEVLRLNPRESEAVQALSQSKGKFSEAFLMAEDRRAVVSIEATPVEHWLATTDPKDFACMRAEREKTGKSGLELIEHLATRFPNGARAS